MNGIFYGGCQRRLLLPAARPFYAGSTGNIGFHHIHHLSSRIPNYYLHVAYERTQPSR